jgi:hypothetical protein
MKEVKYYGLGAFIFSTFTFLDILYKNVTPNLESYFVIYITVSVMVGILLARITLGQKAPVTHTYETWKVARAICTFEKSPAETIWSRCAGILIWSTPTAFAAFGFWPLAAFIFAFFSLGLTILAKRNQRRAKSFVWYIRKIEEEFSESSEKYRKK